MIYLDASVVLAALLAEDRRPAETLWSFPCVASRLTDLEVRVRLARGDVQPVPAVDVESLLGRVQWFELSPRSMNLIYHAAPRALRTLDAIHLATLDFVTREVGPAALATYDRRLAAAARAMHFEVVEP